MEYVDRDNRARNKEGGTDWDEEDDDDAEGATDGGWCCLPEQWHCIDKEGKPFWAGDAYATGLPFQIRQLVTRQIMIVQRSPTAKVRKSMTDGQTDRQRKRQITGKRILLVYLLTHYILSSDLGTIVPLHCPPPCHSTVPPPRSPPLPLQAKLFRSLFLGVLLGTMFLHLGSTQMAANNRYGLIFISLSSITMGAASAIPELFSQRRVLYEQRNGGYFRAVAWQFAMFIVELPIAIVEMLLYCLLLYSLTGMKGGVMSYNFLYFWLTCISLNMTCWSVSLLGVLASPSIVAAQSIVPVYQALNLLFAGYLMPMKAMPAALQWLNTASLLTRPFVGLAINEMSGLVFHCEDGEEVPHLDDPALNISAPNGFNNKNYRACPMATGDISLQYVCGLEAPFPDKWSLLFLNLVYIIIFQVLCFVVLRYIDYSKASNDDPAIATLNAKRKAPPPTAVAAPEEKVGGAREEVETKREISGDDDATTATTEGDAGGEGGSSGGDRGDGGAMSDDAIASRAVMEAIGIDASGCVEFTGLEYAVPIGKKRCCAKQDTKTLLHNISGFALPSRLIALMGPSGAGKTTLLDVLANKKTGGEVRGELLVNGQPRDACFARIAGYVEQMDSHREYNRRKFGLQPERQRDKETKRRRDEGTSLRRASGPPQHLCRILICVRIFAYCVLTCIAHPARLSTLSLSVPSFTVREAIAFGAALRLPAALSTTERAARVDRVITDLLLGPYADHKIGTPGDAIGVSPEVRKKVTIGVEMVMDPSVLFMDEPTTGLDSASALSTMHLVRRVAQGKSVLCTIHQPAQELFGLFDWLLLLQKGGRIAYFGPINQMQRYILAATAPTQECMDPCPEDRNMADYALDFASGAYTTHPNSTTTPLTAADLYDASSWKKAILAHSPARRGVTPGTAPFQSPFARSTLRQVATLMRSQFNYHARDFELLRTRTAAPFAFALIVGGLFFQMEHDQAGVKNRISFIFISLIFSANISNFAIPKQVATRPTVFRERTSNAYTLFPHFLTSYWSEMPFVLLSTLIFVLVSYFMTGLRLDTFFPFLLCQILLSFTCFAFAYMMAALAPNADTATILSTLCSSVFTLFCGFILPLKSIPIYWKWLYYLSLFRYPLGFLVSNEMRGATFVCPNATGGGLPAGAVRRYEEKG